MLIRVSGYNSGVKEYLEEGVKNGRDYSRDELDERVILHGDLDVTDRVYKTIPDRGQNRYTTFTLSFREDEIPNDTLQAITNEFRDFMMYAYEGEEYNFYAEAHLPKLKEVYDRRTGEKIERKPHIHIVVPKLNLLSGKVSDVIGDPKSTERYLEAFQEYVNQKYQLASPRDHVRVNPYNAADVLSRYKGDDFRGKNREFKKELVKEIIDTDIRSRQDFYSAVSKYGETRIRNQGKGNEYIAVRLEGDAKFTNLKETIFNDSFLQDRKLKKPPLEQHIISERLHEWPMRAKEIKYVAKASKSFRDNYYQHSDINEKVKMLADEQFNFYEKFGGKDELHPTERAGSYQRSTAETGSGWDAGPAHSLQGLSGSDVAADRQTRVATGAVFLPGNARIYVERSATGRDSGLRSGLPDGGTGGTEAYREGDEAGREGRTGTQEGGREAGETEAGRRAGASALSSRREGGSEEEREGRKRAEPEGTEGSGGYREGRESPYQGREEAREYHSSTGSTGSTGSTNEPTAAPSDFPNDSGSLEEHRFTFVPGLGRSDTSFTVRGGLSGSGNRQLGIPVYARNTRTIADVSAIERNSKRLFSDSATSAAPRKSQARLIRRVMPHAPKNASYVASCLQRRQEQNSLSGQQRSALYQADQKYYQTRRAIIGDKRLSTKDKTQLLGVLMFERLKAHQLINQPHRQNQQEYYAMSSADIRSKIKSEPKYRNTISGAEEAEKGPQEAKQRFRNMSQQIDESLGERSLREKVRIITAADLYTRKSKLSDNIHYLDKNSDKTLFIDTGKSIAVSKNGLSDSAVAVALELAKEKFGSTLNVKGTPAFKNTAIEVVAQKGLDIHFTDKEMNRRLAERKQELAVEREGQSISGAESARPESVAEFKKAFGELNKDFNELINKAGSLDVDTLQKELNSLSTESTGLRNAWMSSENYTAEARLDEPSIQLEESLRETLKQNIDTESARKELDGLYFDLDVEVHTDYPATTSEFEAAFSIVETLYEMLVKNDGKLTPDELNKYLKDVQETRSQLTKTYDAPDIKSRLDGLERAIGETITGMKNQPVQSPQAAQQKSEPQPAGQRSSKLIEHQGVLLEHGSAPYNFKPDMTKPEDERNDSYYVRLQGARGTEKVVWGVNLETAVQGLNIGERISLTNHGKEKVEWEQQLANGKTEMRSGERVAWEGKPLDRDIEVDEVEQYQTYEQYQSLESEGPSVA